MFNERVADTLNQWLGVGYVIICFGLMGVVPFGLLALFIIGILKGYGPRFGLLLGITVAVWACLCWIVVPYCGGYPNLPGMMIGAAAFGVGTWGQEISVHVTNLFLWPYFGWALFKANERSRSKWPPQDDSNSG